MKCRYSVSYLEMWRLPCLDGLEVNHINGVKADNDRRNLEYLSCSDNHRHAYAIGLHKRPDGQAREGGRWV
jgi:hypothetical protein